MSKDYNCCKLSMIIQTEISNPCDVNFVSQILKYIAEKKEEISTIHDTYDCCCYCKPKQNIDKYVTFQNTGTVIS